MLIKIIILQLTISFALTSEYPIVTTILGKIQGHYKESYDKRKYSAFEGVPYAKPPVESLRFSEPVEAEPWTETLIANSTSACIQISVMPEMQFSGVEDCLYLNVYVPKENPSSDDNFNVVVHIHGGAFMVGSPSIAGPRFLMDRNIIYVSMNYRLGPFGYLSTEDEVVPGNNGQKDQVLALKWVQKHIKQFGGNPNSVTLTGISAGAAAVHFHYFSKLSKGLFHRAISHSGSAFSPWAIQENALGKAKQLGATVGCVSDNTIELIDCLRGKSAQEINDNIKQLHYSYGISPFVLFAPVIEKPSANAFLEDHPIHLLQNKKFNDLPWMSSVAEEEGSISLIVLAKDIQTLDEHWNDEAHHLMDYTYTACDSDKSLIAQKIKEKYFGTKEMNLDNIKNTLKMFGDRFVVHSFQRSAQTQAVVSKSNVFAYINAHKTEIIKMIRRFMNTGITTDYGIGHGEDCGLTYSMDLPLFPVDIRYDEIDTKMKNLILDMIISFVETEAPKIGDIALPSVENSEEFVHLFINDPHNIEVRKVNEVCPMEFWDSLPLNENEKFSKVDCNDDIKITSKSEL